MKHVLKALDAHIKLLNDDLDWHKRELKEVRDNFIKGKRTIEELKQEKEVLMKEIERLKGDK